MARQEFDLMNNYVNYIGKKICSNKQYMKKMLKSVYNRINTSNLDILLRNIMKLKSCIDTNFSDTHLVGKNNSITG